MEKNIKINVNNYFVRVSVAINRISYKKLCGGTNGEIN